MNNNMSLPTIVAVIVIIMMMSSEVIWAKEKEKVTKLHFFFHRTATSGVLIAQPTNPLPMGFGVTIVKDDPLTRGIDLSSEQIGYAQGIAPTTSLEEVSIFETYALVFTHPRVYNGSTLSVAGCNPLLHQFREVAIVGGTGAFRLARGVATYQTVFYNATANLATVEVNVVVFHF